MSQSIFAISLSRQQSDLINRTLLSANIAQEDLALIGPSEPNSSCFFVKSNYWAEGFVLGLIISGVVGALIAPFANVTWMTPAIGGWIGGGIGALLGLLIGFSFSRFEARRACPGQQNVENNLISVRVHNKQDGARVLQILSAFSARDLARLRDVDLGKGNPQTPRPSTAQVEPTGTVERTAPAVSEAPAILRNTAPAPVQRSFNDPLLANPLPQPNAPIGPNATSASTTVVTPDPKMTTSQQPENVSAAPAHQTSSLIGLPLFDLQQRLVGKVENVWADETGELLYLRLTADWLPPELGILVPARIISGYPNGKTPKEIRTAVPQDSFAATPQFRDSDVLTEDFLANVDEYYSNITTASEQTSNGASLSGSENQKSIMELKHEQLKVTKKVISDGGLRIRKVIRTEIVNQPVEIRCEDVIVERVPGK